VFCTPVGLRSGIVGRKLRRQGFSRVVILSGCYYQWLHQRRPVWMEDSGQPLPKVCVLLLCWAITGLQAQLCMAGMLAASQCSGLYSYPASKPRCYATTACTVLGQTCPKPVACLHIDVHAAGKPSGRSLQLQPATGSVMNVSW
jgi:hypothetical protein